MKANRQHSDRQDTDSKEVKVFMSVRLTEDMQKRIHALAQKTRRKPAAIIALCVEDYIPRMEKALGAVMQNSELTVGERTII